MCEVTEFDVPDTLAALLYDCVKRRNGSNKNLESYLGNCRCDHCELVKFDRNPSLGPSIGLSRADRLKRAIDLEIPIEANQIAVVTKYYGH